MDLLKITKIRFVKISATPNMRSEGLLCGSLSGWHKVEQSLWGVRLIIGKMKKKKKKMQETDRGGLQVYTMPAVSVFLTAFLYYSTVEAKP